MTTPPTPPTDNLAAEGGPRSEMSEPMTSETANVIVVVRMADDLRHVLGRAAAAWWAVSAFFALGVALDLLNHDWFGAVFSGLAALCFGLMGRDTWTRRRKYAAELHLADALADLLAARDRRVRGEAWQEGYRQGVCDEATSQDWTGGAVPPARANPCRIEAAQ